MLGVAPQLAEISEQRTTTNFTLVVRLNAKIGRVCLCFQMILDRIKEHLENLIGREQTGFRFELTLIFLASLWSTVRSLDHPPLIFSPQLRGIAQEATLPLLSESHHDPHNNGYPLVRLHGKGHFKCKLGFVRPS